MNVPFTSVLVFGCWLMNHVTYLKLRQQLLLLKKAEQNHKITTIFTENDDFFSQPVQFLVRTLQYAH